MEKCALTKKELANLFDHTLLKAFAQRADFERLCAESRENGFKMVAINSAQVALCHELLLGSPVHVGAAVGFPLGQTTIADKAFETKQAIQNGADEIDYVINISRLKDGDTAYLKEEMEAIVGPCREAGVFSKVIFENCYLTDDEKKRMCEIALAVKPDFIKTSTGFGTSGATVEDVKLMKAMVGDEVKVKAAGGIRDLDTCLAMIAAGAQRIGTSSSLKILQQYTERFGE